MDKKYEPGRETIPPIKIHIHPDWNHLSVNYDGDISLLEWERPISFSEYIQPICLFGNSNEQSATSGVVVGYGKSEDFTKKYENIPKKIEVPIHKQDKCFLTQPNLARLSSTRTFCAGSSDGNGVCSGDSGGGLIIKSSNVYYLYGIVSSSLVRDGLCDLHNYAIFTNVQMYKEWIKSSSNSIANFQIKTPPSSNDCGVMSSSSGLIQNGAFTLRREFPWMVSILIQNGAGKHGGVLVSSRHFISHPASVGWYSNEAKKLVPRPLDHVKVYLGALYHGDSEFVYDASKIVIHPYHKYQADTNINNIAITKLSRTAQINDFIRPVCLWTFNDDINLIRNLPLYAAGYGRDWSGEVSNIRKHAKVSLTTQQDCETKFSRQNEENLFPEGKLFCIRGVDGVPCEYDNHLFVKYNERWYLRGLIELRFVYGNKSCVEKDPILCEDIARNTRWIQSQIDL